MYINRFFIKIIWTQPQPATKLSSPWNERFSPPNPILRVNYILITITSLWKDFSLLFNKGPLSLPLKEYVLNYVWYEIMLEGTFFNRIYSVLRRDLIVFSFVWKAWAVRTTLGYIIYLMVVRVLGYAFIIYKRRPLLVYVFPINIGHMMTARIFKLIFYSYLVLTLHIYNTKVW